MKTLNITLTAALLALVASHMAVAAPNEVQLGEPVIAGSGCPADTSSYAITPSKSGLTLSIRLKEYSAAPGNKTCNIVLPIQVPNGFQVSMRTANYRGSVKGDAELSRSYFFAGDVNAALVANLSSPNGRSYLQLDNLSKMNHLVSACGQDVMLRINSRIRTKTNASNASVNDLVLRVKYQRCSS